jgi:hypothetical protein
MPVASTAVLPMTGTTQAWLWTPTKARGLPACWALERASYLWEIMASLYYLEKAAQLQILAMSTGRELALVPEALAAKACAQWNDYPTRFSDLHFSELKSILNREEPDYTT